MILVVFWLLELLAQEVTDAHLVSYPLTQTDGSLISGARYA